MTMCNTRTGKVSRISGAEDIGVPTGNEDTREDVSGNLGTCKGEDETKETCVDVAWDTPTYGNVAGNAVSWVDTTGRV